MRNLNFKNFLNEVITKLKDCLSVNCVYNDKRKCMNQNIDIDPQGKCKYFKEKPDIKEPEFEEVIDSNGRIRFVRKR